MKKLLSLSLLCLGLFGGARAQTCSTTITTYPYIENFDGATAPGWTSGGTNSSWALGTPAKTVINSAASGTKAWVTSQYGTCNASEQSFVESPCFNMSTLIQPVIEMKIWWNSDFSYDGAVLQSSIDNGATWQVVGAKGDPNNWYNDNSINGAPGGQPAATAQGWTGTSTFSSGGWVTAKHILTGLGGKPNVKLRIAFGSDPVLQYDGFAFDNFAIYDSPANDAAVASITSPAASVTPLAPQPVMVTVKNFGTSPLTAATLGFSVNGVLQPTFPWTGNLALNAASAPVTIGNFAFPAGAYTIKAWSKTPNGAIDSNPANDTVSVNIYSCNTLNGSYTINKAAAASATNFTSFTSAAQTLNNCGVNGPVTFSVAAGSGPYNEMINLVNISGASATNTITFNGNGNTVIGNPPTTTDAVVKLNGAKFVRFNNLKIETLATTTAGSGVQLANNASNNIFNGCIISHNINSTYNLFGIQISAGSSNNTFQNNIINGGSYGVYNAGAAGNLVANNQFIGNTLRDQYTYGFYMGYCTNTLIENNDFSRPARTNPTSNLYGIYLSTGTNSAIISKNIIHNTHDATSSTTGTIYGIYSISPATAGTENIVKNNVLYNINNANGYFYAFYNNGGNGTYYYHNTVTSAPAITYNTLRGMHFTAASTNVKFINNIISLPSNATTKHAIYLSATTIALVSNNNDLYIGTSGNIGYYGAYDKATLADWKATNTNAYDQNTVSVDPVCVNPALGNLKPNSMAVNGLAQPLPAVTDDILGVVRHATTPDLGAYEFGVPANDVGITAVSTPNATGCGLTTAETITVTIKNFGSAPQPAVPVMFFVNGTPMAATPEMYNASPLAPNATATFTFNAKANLAAAGTYVLIAKTQLAGDIITNNDADTLNLTNSLLPALPLVFDFETPSTGLSIFQKETRSNSNIVEHVIASSPFATTSTEGLIMDAVTSSNWVVPAATVDPWTNNPNHFSAIYMCVNPAGGTATDSLWLTFDMKQLFKTGNANTNFRVTVNGTQVGPTYRPPFDPNNPATPNTWRHIKVDLTAFKNAPSIKIGLESSVKEEFANGTGTANLIDNVSIVRRLVILGVKETGLAAKVSVYPNPSNGLFKVSLPANKAFNLEVTDLTGKVIQRQKTVGETELKLQNQAKGIYLLKVFGENGAAVRKLIVE